MRCPPVRAGMAGVLTGIDLSVALELARIEIDEGDDLDLRSVSYLLTRISDGIAAGANK